MIVFRSPKGWTGPREVDGVQIEGTFHAHQVPVSMDQPETSGQSGAVAAELSSRGAVR